MTTWTPRDVEALERAAMEKELAWLLEQQLPLFLQQMKSVLRMAIRPLTSRAQREGEGDASPQPQTAKSKLQAVSNVTQTISTPQDKLSGSIVFEGEAIVRLDIKLKLNRWNRGQLWRTTFIPERSWNLRQLQDAKNYLILALTLLDNFKSETVRTDSRESVDSFLDRLAFLIKQAKDQLIYVDETRVFNESVLNRMIFNPALPVDLMVRFYVLNEKVFMQVHALHFTTTTPSTQMRVSFKDRMTSIPAAGRTFVLNGQPIEVLDYVEVDLSMNSLKQTLGAMNAAYDHCYWFLEKLRLFSSVPQ